MKFNDLPLYELTIDNDNDGVKFISIVSSPAIESNFLCFSKDYRFKIQDNDKHIISGLAMIPDFPIYRCNETNGEFYVKFSADTIRKIAEKFFNEQRTLSVNIEHSTITNNAIVIESYFIDHNRGISPIEYPSAPNGSWYVTMKINDANLWETIKNGNLKGFSIEGVFNISEEFNKIEQVNNVELPKLEEKEIKQIEELKEDIYDIIAKIIK